MYIRTVGVLQNSDGLCTYNIHSYSSTVGVLQNSDGLLYVRTMYTYIKRDWEDALKSTVQACTYLTQALIGSIAAVLAQSGACLFVVTHRHR
jgi:hypothetical protein